MTTPNEQRLSDLQEQVKTLEAKISAERLAQLHTELGFESTMALVSELRRIVRGAPAAGPVRKAKAAAAATKGTSGKRKRVVVTKGHRRQIGKALREGKLRDPEIAKAQGVSLTTVQRIKGELGLQKKRKQKK